jgi:hypothetical protein
VAAGGSPGSLGPGIGPGELLAGFELAYHAVAGRWIQVLARPSDMQQASPARPASKVRRIEAEQLGLISRACERARAAVPADHSNWHAGAPSLKYLYTVCCEAPRRLGVLQPAQPAAAAFDPAACAAEAAERGVWPSAHQRPAALVGDSRRLPGPLDGQPLRAVPVWEPAELGPEAEAVLLGLQAAWPMIRDEAVRAGGWRTEAERLHEAGRWTQLQLWQFGVKQQVAAPPPRAAVSYHRSVAQRAVRPNGGAVAARRRPAPHTRRRPVRSWRAWMRRAP